MKLRRFLGYSLLVFSAVATFVFISPIFPIGVEAFLIGAVFFSLGLWALSGPYLRTILKRTARTIRKTQVAIDPLLPVRILRLAKERGGTLTVSNVAIELNVPLDQAAEGLMACIRAGNATEDFDIPRGHTLYRFPEFLPPEDRRLTE